MKYGSANTQLIDPATNQTNLKLTANGQLQTLSKPTDNGQSEITQLTYDTNNQLVSITIPDNITETFAHGEFGLLENE